MYNNSKNKFLKYPLRNPAQLRQPFGVNKKNYSKFFLEGHDGVDFIVENGIPVLAMHEGYVSLVCVDNERGNGIEITSNKTENINGKTSLYKTNYWHLSEVSCKQGDYVSAGDVIGLSGNTGFSSGPHLHIALAPLTDTKSLLFPQNGFAGFINPLFHINFSWINSVKEPLMIGSKSKNVLNLQDILWKLGYFSQEDMYPNYGNKTNTAVRTMQMFLIGEENLSPKYLKEWYNKNKSVVGKTTIELLEKLSN